MESIFKIYAKSKKRDGKICGDTTLIEHTEHVVSLSIFLAEQYGMDKDLAKKIAILHDIGKAHPEFRRRIVNPSIEDIGVPFRHEIASMFFIGCFSKEEHPILLEGIIAHHKSTWDDVRKRGFMNLYNDDDATFNNHVNYKDYKIWFNHAFEILDYFKLDYKKIDIEQAKETYDWAFEYIDKIEFGMSPWKGLLMSADHLASALHNTNNVNEFLTKRQGKINLDFFLKRKNEIYPLSIKSFDSKKKTHDSSFSSWFWKNRFPNETNCRK